VPFSTCSKPIVAPTLVCGGVKAGVYVVDQTANKGKVDYKIKLSITRAAAVTAALVKAGIDSSRLSAKGLGPLAPLATNQTGQGQAKNRRVELVAE
jgi:OmpA-OmpF porin, OOP family